MSDFHEQAVRDAAKAWGLTAAQVRERVSISDDPVTRSTSYYREPRLVYAVSQRERVLELEAELELQRGANRAQDERERKAAERLGMVHNCDWPDEVAEMVLGLAHGIVEEYNPCVFSEAKPNLEWCYTHSTKRCGQKALFEKASALLAAPEREAPKAQNP